MVLGVKGASTAAMEFACETGNVSKQLQGDKERLRKDAEAAKHGSESVKILIQKEILKIIGNEGGAQHGLRGDDIAVTIDMNAQTNDGFAAAHLAVIDADSRSSPSWAQAWQAAIQAGASPEDFARAVA